jgi:hypothetical protein
MAVDCLGARTVLYAAAVPVRKPCRLPVVARAANCRKNGQLPQELPCRDSPPPSRVPFCTPSPETDRRFVHLVSAIQSAFQIQMQIQMLTQAQTQGLHTLRKRHITRICAYCTHARCPTLLRPARVESCRCSATLVLAHARYGRLDVGVRGDFHPLSQSGQRSGGEGRWFIGTCTTHHFFVLCGADGERGFGKSTRLQ